MTRLTLLLITVTAAFVLLLAGALFVCIDGFSTSGRSIQMVAVAPHYKEQETFWTTQPNGQGGIVMIPVTNPSEYLWECSGDGLKVNAKIDPYRFAKLSAGDAVKVWETHGWITGMVYGYKIQ